MAENIVWHASDLSRSERWAQLHAVGAVVWLTGLSGSGKSTIAVALERRLVSRAQTAVVLDGDNLRHGLNADLGFTAADRAENIRRVGEVAAIVADAGVVAVVPLISPYRASRDQVRQVVTDKGLAFFEVFVDTDIAECERRDPKGLYAKARRGELPGFTGIDDPYEPPLDAELTVSPDQGDADDLAAAIERLIFDR